MLPASNIVAAARAPRVAGSNSQCGIRSKLRRGTSCRELGCCDLNTGQEVKVANRKPRVIGMRVRFGRRYSALLSRPKGRGNDPYLAGALVDGVLGIDGYFDGRRHPAGYAISSARGSRRPSSSELDSASCVGWTRVQAPRTPNQVSALAASSAQWSTYGDGDAVGRLAPKLAPN